MKIPRYTIDTLHQQFPDDDACLDFMFERHYGSLEACPKCGVTNPRYYRVRGRKCYACNDCGYQLSPLANTIFHKSDTSLKKWFYAIYLFGVGKNGVSAKEIERHLGVTYKCAWRMAKQIRLMMQQGNNPLYGIVEIDETYIGGRHKGDEGKFDNKTAVIGMVEKRKGSEIQSDESKIYHRVKREYIHRFINHSQEEYSKDGISTNTIEGFWSQMKRSIDGTYHCVSPKYLQYYVNEFVYRYNHRDVAAFPGLLEASVQHVQ